MGRSEKDDIESEQRDSFDPKQKKDNEGVDDTATIETLGMEVPVAVVEQRVSNLAQGSMCLVLLTGPFLHVLHLIPRGVLAGLL